MNTVTNKDYESETNNILPCNIKINSVIVSAFIPANKRDPSIYFENPKRLLELDIYKIIFIDPDFYKQYYINHSFPKTKFIMFNRDDIYLNKYRHLITDFNIYTDNPDKDTIDYMLTICHKTEWVKLAIESKIFNSDQYIWIDFGIFYIFKNNIDQIKRAQNALYQICNKYYSYIRIPNGWNPDYCYLNNTFNQIAWFFLGGIFGGNIESLYRFADLMKEKCINIIENKHTLVWEVNIWYLIYRDLFDKNKHDKNKHDKLFNIYNADHNLSILELY